VFNNEGFLNFVGTKRVLHSHSFSVSTHLFHFFTAKFTAESPQIESKQKGEFIFWILNVFFEQNKMFQKILLERS